MTNWTSPILTVDIVLLRLRQGVLEVFLHERPEEPFQGVMALPGGYVRANEDADTLATVRRILADKMNLHGIYCEQLQTFSGATRDPRGWSATVVYLGLVDAARNLKQAQGSAWVEVAKLGDIAFDHAEIIAAAADRVRNKGAYSTLPAHFLPEAFTFSELREIYEQATGVKRNDSAFRRKIEELDVIEKIQGSASKATARPAQLFRLRDAALSYFDRKV